MATQFNQAQAQKSDKLPSQIVENTRTMSAITLKYVKQLEVLELKRIPQPTSEKEVDLIAPKRKCNKHAISPSTSSAQSND